MTSETQFDAVTTKSVINFEKEEEAENNRKKALTLLCFCCPFEILISTSIDGSDITRNYDSRILVQQRVCMASLMGSLSVCYAKRFAFYESYPLFSR